MEKKDPAVFWIWMIFCVFFVGGLAVIFLSDAFHTKRCTKLLNDGKTTSAQIEKIKKNRRGQFVWKLYFKTVDGAEIHGTRVALNHNGKGNPVGTPTVIYSNENLSCWDLSMKPGEKALPIAARTLTLQFTLILGWCLAFMALVGTIYAFWKLR